MRAATRTLGLLLPLFCSIGLISLSAVAGSAAEPFRKPLPNHPGNIFIAGESVSVPLPESLPLTDTEWRLLDDQRTVIRSGHVAPGRNSGATRVDLPDLGVGWYRVEFGATNQTNLVWTTLAVLSPLKSPTPRDTPIALDCASAWFAKDDPTKQAVYANLAALAGVGWVRDRLRWGEIEPRRGELTPARTTYDTSAAAQLAAGLQTLQVFHDTPIWARENSADGGRFAPDLRDIYRSAKSLARRFHGQVAAWEPWNEANFATFGGHTVDEMCSWQKAAWLGFKAGDPKVIVGWNVSTAVPTPAHTHGLLANETAPYFDTYNIHTYDWSHSYQSLWGPARDATWGKPLWVTEADRGTPHLKNPPWYDQSPRLEKLKAEWMAQSYASSLFAGAQRHFHFILGNYQEPNGIQFGLLRHDLTPRPAYVALAAIGRNLAGARVLGRWQPGHEVRIYAFRARPDGKERDVLVVWAEKEVDWDGRGVTTADWHLPSGLKVLEVMDYLGRSCGKTFPSPLTSAPVFVILPRGEADQLPLEKPAPPAAKSAGKASTLVLQLQMPREAIRKVEDLPWSEGYAYRATPGTPLPFKLRLYNFGRTVARGRVQLTELPLGWNVALKSADFETAPMEFSELRGELTFTTNSPARDGWVVLHAESKSQPCAALAFRALAH